MMEVRLLKVLRAMRFLRNVALVFIALMLFVIALQRYGGAMFDSIFDLADGDATLLSLGLCVASALLVAGVWAWSVKSKRRAQSLLHRIFVAGLRQKE